MPGEAIPNHGECRKLICAVCLSESGQKANRTVSEYLVKLIQDYVSKGYNPEDPKFATGICEKCHTKLLKKPKQSEDKVINLHVSSQFGANLPIQTRGKVHTSSCNCTIVKKQGKDVIEKKDIPQPGPSHVYNKDDVKHLKKLTGVSGKTAKTVMQFIRVKEGPGHVEPHIRENMARDKKIFEPYFDLKRAKFQESETVPEMDKEVPVFFCHDPDGFIEKECEILGKSPDNFTPLSSQRGLPKVRVHGKFQCRVSSRGV